VTVLYLAAHGFAEDALPLGGGAAVCSQLLREWSRTQPFPVQLVSPAILGLQAGGNAPSGSDLVRYNERQYAAFCRRFEAASTAEVLRHDPARTVVLVNDISEGPDFGRLAAAGFPMVTIYHVDVVANSSVPAIAYIQRISADGIAIQLTNPVRIPPRRQRIVFGYVGLSLSVLERVRFRYRLDGSDHDWSEPVAGREAAYPNLSPGPYRFRVIASNPDGVWSKNEAAISFAVDPVFWQTLWFQLCAALAVAAAVFALYRFRLHQMAIRLNVRFEERLAERTRIAQELHDTLLQGFLSASMHVHVAADRLPPRRAGKADPHPGAAVDGSGDRRGPQRCARIARIRERFSRHRTSVFPHPGGTGAGNRRFSCHCWG